MPTTIERIFAEKNTKLSEKMNQVEQVVLNDTTLTSLGRTTGRSHSGGTSLQSHLFLRKATGYGFELVALVYKGNGYTSYVNEEGIELREPKWEINRFYELEYNLRDNIALVRKNCKELNFSEQNIQNMFAGYQNRTVLRWLDEQLATTMYTDMYEQFGKIGGELTTKVARFLTRFMQLRQAELIYKSGVPMTFAKKFAEDLGRSLQGNYRMEAHYRVDLTATSPAKVLGVPKSMFKLICAGVYSYTDYVTFTYFMNNVGDTKVEQSYIRGFGNLWHLYQFALTLDDKYGISKVGDVMHCEALAVLREESEATRLNNFDNGSACALSRAVNTDFYRMVEYCYYQLNVEQGADLYRMNHYNRLGEPYSDEYKDYLSMAYQLSARRDIYPKHLRTQHDILARNMKVVEDIALAELMEKRREQWVEWETIGVRGSKYCIIAPKDLSELADEATQMSNCVAGYANSVARGRTNIVFLREKETPDKSVVTVEIRKGTLVQAYQRFNTRITVEQAEFLIQWCKKAGVTLGSIPVSGGEDISYYVKKVAKKQESSQAIAV